jgi:hypothetical protein
VVTWDANCLIFKDAKSYNLQNSTNNVFELVAGNVE